MTTSLGPATGSPYGTSLEACIVTYFSRDAWSTGWIVIRWPKRPPISMTRYGPEALASILLKTGLRRRTSYPM